MVVLTVLGGDISARVTSGGGDVRVVLHVGVLRVYAGQVAAILVVDVVTLVTVMTVTVTVMVMMMVVMTVTVTVIMTVMM